MKFPVFDLHCDTASALLGESLRACGSLNENGGHVDLNRAAKLPGYAQCFACCSSPLEKRVSPTALFERQLATVMREVERSSGRIALAYSAREVERNLSKGQMSAILTIEGPAGFDYDPALLEDLYLVGFRMTTLCWNEANPLTGSHLTGEGLTAQGREYVRQAQRLGMLVDVSHMSDRGFWDVMEITQKPVIASHSNSRKVCGHSRNLTDDMFLALVKTGGVTGINLYADFLGESPDLDTVWAHIAHFLTLDPTGKHICLGGDLDGCDRLPSGFSGVDSYGLLAEHLLKKGMEEEQIQDLFWNNALEVFRCCT